MISSFPKYLLIAALLIPGCAPKKPSEARLSGDIDRSSQTKQRPTAEIEKEAVVRVDGEAVTLGQFNRRLQDMPEFARARFSTTEQKQSYLDSVAQFELMADVAEEQGFGERAEVIYALEAALAERLVEQVISQKLSMNDIEDEAIERYYNDHLDEFRTAEARRVALIRIDSRQEAERIRPKVLVAMKQAEMEQAEDSAINAFRRAAARHSVDRAVAKEGGDIGFVEPEPSPDETSPDETSDSDATTIAQQVFALGEVGEVTPVFAVDDGFALATFFEERKASVVSLEEASGEIRAKLYEQRKRQIERELIAELRESTDIERFDEAIQKAKAAPEPTARRVEDIEVYEVAPVGVAEVNVDQQANKKNKKQAPTP